MNLINYDPSKIESEYNTLILEVNSDNEKANKAYRNRNKVLIWMALISLVASLLLWWQVFTTNARLDNIALIMLILGVALYIAYGISKAKRPAIINPEDRFTFKIKFWLQFRDAEIIKIEKNSTSFPGIDVTYKEKNDKVHVEAITATNTVIHTDVKELTLDVESGYILKPLDMLYVKEF